MTLLKQIQSEQDKKTEEINKIEFGAVISEIRHGKVYRTRVINDYAPEKGEKVLTNSVERV